MNYKQVQRYIRLTELVPDLQKMVDEKKLAFTPAVEISFIRPKNQRYIAVSIEGQQSSPSLSQAQKMRELDKDGKLNGDVIDGILSQEKKEVDKVIINMVTFLFCVASAVCELGCIVLTLLSLILFIGGQTVGGIVFLVLAFLVSPFGVPAIAEWLVDKLHSAKFALRDFITG